MRPLALAMLLPLLALAGCAGGMPRSTTHTPSSRGHCITDPTESPTRPMFFLFCVETP